MHSLIIYFGEDIFEIFKALAMIEIFCQLFKSKYSAYDNEFIHIFQKGSTSSLLD